MEEKVEKTEKEAMELMHKQKKRYMEKDEKVKGVKDFIKTMIWEVEASKPEMKRILLRIVTVR